MGRLGFFLATGLIVSTVLATRSLERSKKDSTDVIQVTGSAKRRIVSDMIVWSAYAEAEAKDMRTAYRDLAQISPKVLAYLEKKGIAKAEITVSSVGTMAIHPTDKEGRQIEAVISSYRLSQNFSVRSSAVEKVAQISREATELINDGIALTSGTPEYHYTKLGDLKIQMLAEASKDAKVRAEEMVHAVGEKLGPLRSARMGVLQINPAESTEVSSEGNNDVSSLEKDVIAVVSTTFAIK